MKNMFVFPLKRTILVFVVLISLVFTTSPVQSKQKKDILRAGIAKIDITPEKHHQRTSLYVGSKPLVEDVAKVLRG